MKIWNTTVPVSAKEVFLPGQHKQRQVRIPIYEGQSEFQDENHKLGEVVLRDLNVVERSDAPIEVAFELAADGTLSVRATDLTSGTSEALTIEARTRLTPAEEKKLTEEQAAWATRKGFERTLLSLDAPIDRFLAGDSKAISDSAKRGWALYNSKARCNTCHGRIDVLPLFTDDLFHNIGVGVQRVDFDAVARKAAAAVERGVSVDELALSNAEASELGRFLITREQKDMGAFKTPQLRNVALTAPYMHDGSEATLADVIEFYDRGGNNNPYLDGGMRPLGLTKQEQADLVALLETFTSSDLARFAELEKLVAK